MIIKYLISRPFSIILLYLNQSAHIIDQICESDVECRPQDTHSSEEQSPHALFHETVDMFDAAACLRLDSVVFFLFLCFGTITKLASTIFPSLTISPIEASCSLNFSNSFMPIPASAMIFLYFHMVFSSGTSSTLWMSRNSMELIRSFIWYSIWWSLILYGLCRKRTFSWRLYYRLASSSALLMVICEQTFKYTPKLPKINNIF